MKLRHFDNDGEGRFQTFNVHNQLPLLTDNGIRQIIINEIDNARNKFGFRLIAYVLMPEHVHIVLIPKANSKVGFIIGEIKRFSSKRIHEYLIKQKSKLLEKLIVKRNDIAQFVFWQRRCYDHNIRSEKAMWEKVNYCHNNPVKRGMVKSPADWKWSSYNYYYHDSDFPLKIDLEG